MLRISIREVSGEPVTLRLDDQIAADWVNLLRRICELELKKQTRVALDLQHVTFADRQGIALLRTLAGRGIEIRSALPFIADQIGSENE